MKRRQDSKLILFTLLIISITGCALFAANEYDSSSFQERYVAFDSEWGQKYQTDIKPIFDKRCVVCHGCYDAPCQLKLTSPAGIDRGANKERVYDGARILAAEHVSPSADAYTTKEWRKKGFYPVLNEGEASEDTNRKASLIYRYLELKNQHPLPGLALLPKDITLDLNRSQACPNIYQFDEFSKRFPLWGMPYGLPALSQQEQSTLVEWIDANAPMASPAPLNDNLQKEVERWEAFFNQASLKSQLVSRYIFEHLYLFHLYYQDDAELNYFQLVRSYTPTGEAIELIDTVRPYDDPGVNNFYYRLKVVDATLVSKTHMPYELSDARLERWKQLFFQPEYGVKDKVSYQAEVASNPFVAFQQLPVDSRYRFMLDDAEKIIMAFMKGPVCRGQIALDVIRDRFWVFFSNPNVSLPADNAEFLAINSSNLQLPAGKGNPVLLTITDWRSYATQQKTYLKNKYQYEEQLFEQSEKINLDLIWNGEGKNPNAALTVFRHFDSASVVRGLVGKKPETAWVIDYSIFERIHYLLVAGYNVFGNVGHQLLTRLYMDFLRMESEINFIEMLPRDARQQVWQEWYEDADKHVNDYFDAVNEQFFHETNISYKTNEPREELLGLLSQRVSDIKDQGFNINKDNTPQNYLDALEALNAIPNRAVQELSDVTFLSIENSEGKLSVFTLIRNDAHKNVTTLFDEKDSRSPVKDTVTVVNGFIGAYPNTFWHVYEDQLDMLVDRVLKINSNQKYSDFMAIYGIRRTAENFWQHSDQLHSNFEQKDPINYSLFDYSRLENR
ncbi:MAG: fatty acid cis/trans isomerase [Pseudomonadota bacterium]